MTALPLKNCRILLVEDEYLLATEMRDELQDAGAIVVGPVADLSKALTLIEATEVIDGAVLDVNLQGEAAFPAAEILQNRKVPTLFVSGYNIDVIPARFANLPHCEKPVAAHRVIQTLIRTMQEPERRTPSPK